MFRKGPMYLGSRINIVILIVLGLNTVAVNFSISLDFGGRRRGFVRNLQKESNVRSYTATENSGVTSISSHQHTTKTANARTPSMPRHQHLIAQSVVAKAQRIAGRMPTLMSARACESLGESSCFVHPALWLRTCRRPLA